MKTKKNIQSTIAMLQLHGQPPLVGHTTADRCIHELQNPRTVDAYRADSVPTVKIPTAYSVHIPRLVAISRVMRWLSPGHEIRVRLTITRGGDHVGLKAEGWKLCVYGVCVRRQSILLYSYMCRALCTLYRLDGETVLSDHVGIHRRG